METKSYKRTVAGSVGAGMGALFNASGRTYYMLEHKTNTKYHNAGDTQKIIIDQIELGRDGGCQVRFDEGCETVSRKHAAIVREGQNWKLVHLSKSNPTLVNGQPIQGDYFLQSGDEIQLSVGGPRMGFIVPQGKQALTSSIGLTERMSLFRQQALRPYKRALWAMAAVLLLVIAGFGYWNYELTQKNEKLMDELIALTASQDSIQRVQDERQLEIAELNDKIAHSSGAQRTVYIRQREAIQTDVNRSNEELQALNGKRRGILSHFDGETSKIDNDKEEYDEPEIENEDRDNVNNGDNSNNNDKIDISEYTPLVYSLKIDNIKISYAGVDIQHTVANPGVIGNGFLIDNGNFVTARQNVQPWIYSGVITDGSWRNELAQYFACGCDIEIQYSAYSATGAANKFTFTTRDFQHPADYVTTTIEITKSIRTIFKKNGFKIDYEKNYSRTYSQFAPHSSCYAVIRGLASGGIPTYSGSIEGGHPLKIAGYEGTTNVHNLSTFRYMTSTTEYKDEANGTYILQDGSNAIGFLGSPAFIQNGNEYKVVGVYVGKLFDRPRIVPISRCR